LTFERAAVERMILPRLRAAFGSIDLMPLGRDTVTVRLFPPTWPEILERWRAEGLALDPEALVAIVWGREREPPRDAIAQLKSAVEVTGSLDFEDRAIEDSPSLLAAAILFYRPLLALVEPRKAPDGTSESVIELLARLIPRDAPEREARSATYEGLCEWIGDHSARALAWALPRLAALDRLPQYLAELEQRLSALGYELTPSGAPRPRNSRRRGEAPQWETPRFLALVDYLRARRGLGPGSKAGVRGASSQRPALLAIYRDADELLRGAFPFLRQRSDENLEALYNKLRRSW